MVSRRQFLQGTAVVLATPASVWAEALGANDRITLGVIGTGGMGTNHLRGLVERRERDNVVVKRVCDVYRRRLNNAVKVIEGGADSGTMEYREVLDDPDVDAVLIATPDHWHTKIAIEAMEAGKDVYVEKPLSLTIEQAIDCRDAVRAHRTRAAGRSPGNERRPVLEGGQGDRRRAHRQAVTWSQASYCRNSRERPVQLAHRSRRRADERGPQRRGLRLVGPVARARVGPCRADPVERRTTSSASASTSPTTAASPPTCSTTTSRRCCWRSRVPTASTPRGSAPSGGRYLEKDERDIMDTFMMTVDYPSEHTVMLVSVMTNDVGVPTVIHGQHGTMEFGDRVVAVKEQSAWWEDFRKTNAGLFSYRMVTDEEGNRVPEPKAGEGEVRHPHVTAPRSHGQLPRRRASGGQPPLQRRARAARRWSRSRWAWRPTATAARSCGTPIQSA